MSAQFTIYGLILGRFGPFLYSFARLFILPPFPLQVFSRLYRSVTRDAVQKTGKDVPWRSRVEIAGKDRSSGATATFMRWNGRGMDGESNGHDIKVRTAVGGYISQMLGGAVSVVANKQTSEQIGRAHV